MPLRPPSANHLKLRDVPAAILLGAAVFLITRNLFGFAFHLYVLHKTFGFHNIGEEFFLSRFLLISILPFGFNLVFGIYFGLKFNQFLAREPNALIGLLANPALWGLLLWWFVFNLPHFTSDTWINPYPIPDWQPSADLYNPLHVELILFRPLGNRALLAGFFFLVGYKRLAPILHEEWQKILGRPHAGTAPSDG